MDTSMIIITLALVTLVAGVLFGIWQVIRARRAQARGTHSALAHTEHEPKGTE